MSHEGVIVLETNHQVDAPNDFQATTTVEKTETNDDTWWDDTELTGFVEANEFELVECPWQPGVEMTLSEVTLGWPVPIRAHNADSVLAQLRQSLENKKKQQSEDELKSILDDNPEETDTTDHEESKTKPSDDLIKQSSSTTASKIEQPTQKTINNETTASEILSLGTQTTDLSIVPKPATVTPPLPESPIIATNISHDSISYINTSTEDALPAINIDQTKIETPQIYLKPQERKSTDSNITSDFDQLDTPKELEKAPIAPEVKETDAPLLLEPTDKPGYYIQDIVTETAAIQTAEYLMPEVFETDVVELQELETIESDDFMQTGQVLAEIAEATKEISLETAHIVHEILTEVVSISSVYHEEIADEEHKKEQVVELFAELLETLGIDHTPELLELLSRLTLNGHFAATLENLSGLDEAEEPHKSSLAGKIIQQLTVTLARIKATASQACAIGKSALRHYGLSIDALEAYNF